ncbi:hypothetical protein [Gordonia sp. N1V]|uniref:hypothetical protein n=1 Tax=Gordonia sp. N1V TaxID=3034163 RepID=UPI0023E294AD|nr:hypothetical protein [Gordonia sp. N1V]MDF3281373.1 hypothetical protein [Gordonia sp. N1V]
MTDDPDLVGPPTPPAAQALLHCDRCGQRTAHDRIGCRACRARAKLAAMTPEERVQNLVARLNLYDTEYRERRPYNPYGDLIGPSVGVDIEQTVQHLQPHIAEDTQPGAPDNTDDDLEFISGDGQFVVRRENSEWQWTPHPTHCTDCEPAEFDDEDHGDFADEIGFEPPAPEHPYLEIEPRADPYAMPIDRAMRQAAEAWAADADGLATLIGIYPDRESAQAALRYRELDPSTVTMWEASGSAHVLLFRAD